MTKRRRTVGTTVEFKGKQGCNPTGEEDAGCPETGPRNRRERRALMSRITKRITKAKP